MAPALSWAKLCIYEYMESYVPFITPNLSLNFRASMAAEIRGVAGGLTPLSKLLACHMLLPGLLLHLCPAPTWLHPPQPHHPGPAAGFEDKSGTAYGGQVHAGSQGDWLP